MAGNERVARRFLTVDPFGEAHGSGIRGVCEQLFGTAATRRGVFDPRSFLGSFVRGGNAYGSLSFLNLSLGTFSFAPVAETVKTFGGAHIFITSTGLAVGQYWNVCNTKTYATTLNNARLSFDVENRLSEYTTGSFVGNYAYEEANRRVDRWSGTTYDNVYFYRPNGKLLTVVQVNFNPTAPYVTATTLSNRIYFGKMLLGTTNGQVNTDSSLIKDRLGSVQPSYAYGTATGSGEQTSPGDDFATYWKDTSTGFEYAMNRYYSTGYGRFLTVDPFGGSARAVTPGTWNRYTYSANDPVNLSDPTGALAPDPPPPDDGGSGSGAWDGPWTDCEASSQWNSIFADDPIFGWNTFGPDPFGIPACGGLLPFLGGLFGATGGGSLPSGAQFAGFFDALDALRKSGCANLIAGSTGDSAAVLRNLLWSAPVTVGPLSSQVTWVQNSDGTYSYSYQTASTANGNIQLNANYFPNPAQENIATPDGGATSLLQLVNGALGSSMNVPQFGEFVFLHELSHMAGQNAASVDNNYFNQSIVSKCIN